jgi:hypothetical protein
MTDGGHGGGTDIRAAGGWGFGRGGNGNHVGGDGGGGGGGGGWFGGGGGGGGCHGMGGGGGSSWLQSSGRSVDGVTSAGRGSPGGTDGWVVITAEAVECGKSTNEKSFFGCYHDCATQSDGDGSMDRVCDDAWAVDVNSAAECTERCTGYKYMGLACPRASVFECWCCDELDKTSTGAEGIIPSSECSGGDLSSGVNSNRHDHCSGFRGLDGVNTVENTFAGGRDSQGGYLLIENGKSYFLGGHCRAAIYTVQSSADTAVLMLDARMPASYAGSGNSWINLAHSNSFAAFTDGTPGFEDGAIVFGGATRANVDLSAMGFHYTASWTIELYINPGSSQAQYAGIFGDHDCIGTTGMVMQQRGSRTNGYYWGTGSPQGWHRLGDADLAAAPTIEAPTGEWTHIVFVADKPAGTVVVYVNGESIMGDYVYDYAYDVAECPAGTNFEIGDGWGNGHGRTWKGKMKKFAIYSDAKSGAQVADLFANRDTPGFGFGSGTGAGLPGGAAQYLFDENADDTLGIRHGAVTGATLTADRNGVANSAYDFGAPPRPDVIVVSTPFRAGDSDFTIAIWMKPRSGNFDGDWHGFIGYENGGTRSPSMWINHAGTDCNPMCGQGPGGNNDGPLADDGGAKDADGLAQSAVHYDTRTTQLGDGTRFGGIVDGMFAVDTYVHLVWASASSFQHYIYKDGVQIAARPAPPNGVDLHDEYRVGGVGGGCPGVWCFINYDGVIDEVTFYDVTLGAVDVGIIFAGGTYGLDTVAPIPFSAVEMDTCYQLQAKDMPVVLHEMEGTGGCHSGSPIYAMTGGRADSFRFVDMLCTSGGQCGENDANNGKRVVSIESCQQPGRYLRHCNYHIWTGDYGTGPNYDFTWYLREGANGAIQFRTTSHGDRDIEVVPGNDQRVTMVVDGAYQDWFLYPVATAAALPPGEGPVDPASLVGDRFSCTGAKQTYTAAVDGTVTVWLSGAGGGFGTLAHPANTGGAAGLSYASWSLAAGDAMDVYVGCKGTDGGTSGVDGSGGGGGGGSALLLSSTQEVLLVAGGAGGQAGSWDANRQNTYTQDFGGVGTHVNSGETESGTRGGHGGGLKGEQGGTTPCNMDCGRSYGGTTDCSADKGAGGAGGTQNAAGIGGSPNRGYDPGQPGNSHDGGDGGGNSGNGNNCNNEAGNRDCINVAIQSPGGWGWGSGGGGRAVPGDGGGAGGGGGWFGGGGGSGGCHGTGEPEFV